MSSTVTRRMASAVPSPKVLAQAATSVVVFLLARLGVDLDEETAAALAVVLGFAAGYLVKPGAVVVTRQGESLAGDRGYYDPLYLLVVVIVVIILLYVLLRLLG